MIFREFIRKRDARTKRTIIAYSIIFSLVLLFTLMALPVLLQAGQEPNLLDSYTHVSSKSVSGDLNVLYRPGLAAEGENPFGPESVVLESAEAYISVDFGSPKIIKSLLIQAENTDKFVFEASLSGNWVTLWNVPTVYAGIGINPMGLRVRTTVLPQAVQTRHLRIRSVRSNSGRDPRAAVSRLQVYSSVPGHWPVQLSYKQADTYHPLLFMIDISDISTLKLFLSFATVLLMTWALMARRISEGARERQIRRALMTLMILLSCFAWPNFLNFRFGPTFHMHDMFHYFMGAKYSSELGYTRLYDCALIADLQDGLGQDDLSRTIRDLKTNELIYATQVMQKPGKCLSHFSDERWTEFRSDVRWFRNTRDKPAWNKIFMDHGFNASPAWMVLGAPLSNMAPLSQGLIRFIVTLDYLMLLAAAILIYRTFGPEAAVAASAFFCLSPFSSFGFNGDSFLRFGWLLWLTIGICAMYTNRNRLAGFALIYSALLRIFPVFVFVGIAIKILADLVRSKSLRPLLNHKDLLTGVLIALALLIPLSLVASGRAGIWGEFQKNTQKHVSNVSKNAVGLPRVLEDVTFFNKTNVHPYLGYVTIGNTNKLFSEFADRKQTVIKILAILAVTILFAFSIRHKELWVSATLSLGLVPFFINLSHYYFMFMAVFGVLWVRKPSAAYALGVLQVLAWLLFALVNDAGDRYTLTAGLFLIYVCFVFTLFALDKGTGAVEGSKEVQPSPDIQADA